MSFFRLFWKSFGLTRSRDLRRHSLQLFFQNYFHWKKRGWIEIEMRNRLINYNTISNGVERIPLSPRVDLFKFGYIIWCLINYQAIQTVIGPLFSVQLVHEIDSIYKFYIDKCSHKSSGSKWPRDSKLFSIRTVSVYVKISQSFVIFCAVENIEHRSKIYCLFVSSMMY